MKNMINIRNYVIIALCITIICMGIGFSVLSMELEKKNKKVDSFDVSFKEYFKVSSAKGGVVEPTGNIEITKSGKELNMQFALNVAHDELEYKVVIKNNGTIPAEIVDIMASPDYEDNRFKSLIEPITISVSELSGKVLEPDEEIDLKIYLYYNPSLLTGSRNFNYKLGLIAKEVNER